MGLADVDKTITSQQVEHQLDGSSPVTCVLKSHSPSTELYVSLTHRIEVSSTAWLQEFVSLGGLDSLLDALCAMMETFGTGTNSASELRDAILQLDCLMCIRAVLNSQTGMDALVNSSLGMRKLFRIMDSPHTLPRKKGLEILAAVCAYNNLAYRRLLEAMEVHRKEKHLYHKFSVIVNELKMAETVPHKTSILTFINTIIANTSNITQRCCVRNEFIGLGLLDVLAFLQREDSDEDLYVQLQAFKEKKHIDELCNDVTSALDLCSPQDLTDGIQSKVFGGPKMVCFVNILQDLFALEAMAKPKSDQTWQVLERHVRHIVHGFDDIDSLHYADTETACQAITAMENAPNPAMQTDSTQANQQAVKRKHSSTMRRQTSSTLSKRDTTCFKTAADSGYLGYEDKLSPPACVVVDTSCSRNASPNSRPQEFDFKDHSNMSKPAFVSHHSQDDGVFIGDNCTGIEKKTGPRQISQYDNMSPIKLPPKPPMKIDREDRPPLNNLNLQNLDSKDKATDGKDTDGILKDAIRDSKTGTKENHPMTLNIRSLSSHISMGEVQALKKSSENQARPSQSFLAYQKYGLAYPATNMKNLKWIKLDDKTVDEYPKSIWMHNAGKAKVTLDFDQVEEMFREQPQEENSEMALLSKTTALNLNLFLHRLEEDPTELIQQLVRVDGPCPSLAFMKHLMGILPDPDEIKHLKHHKGEMLNLGQAEQFMIHLSDIPDYHTLLTGQLRRAEFEMMAPRLRTVLTSMQEASRMILANEGLREIMLLVLKLGNFLNHGQFNGQAGGFKLNSLSRLGDLLSQDPGQNLLHFLVSAVDSKDGHLLSFLSEIPRLEKAASCSPAEIKHDFDKLNLQINSFVRLLATTSTVVKNRFNGFMEEVKREFRELQSQISDLKHQSQQLAEFFCESESFELQACFQTLLSFFKKLRACRQEIPLMKKQKIVATRHSNMLAQQLETKTVARRFGQEAGASSSIMEDRQKQQLVEILLLELRRGNFSPSSAKTPSLQQPQSLLPLVSNPTVTDPEDQRDSGDKMKTPDRELNPMELSRISLMGTPMINRPSSEVLDDEMTISTLRFKPKLVLTSSVKNLPETMRVTSAPSAVPSKAPVMAIPKPLGRDFKKHHRSKSDLAESSNITHRWIRYQDQLKLSQQPAPLARPESLNTLATLNLENGRSQRYQPKAALVTGPTVVLPASEEIELPEEFARHGKKGERRSAFSDFFSRILRPHKSQSHNVAKGGSHEERKSAEDCKSGDVPKGDKHKGGSLGRASGAATKGKMRTSSDDKENVCDNGVNPFDRNKKNPIRLSNRFKSKILK